MVEGWESSESYPEFSETGYTGWMILVWGSTPLVLVLSYCIPVRRVYQLVLYHLARSNSKHVSYLIPVSVLYKVGVFPRLWWHEYKCPRDRLPHGE
jgi:hypothetical protein